MGCWPIVSVISVDQPFWNGILSALLWCYHAFTDVTIKECHDNYR